MVNKNGAQQLKYYQDVQREKCLFVARMYGRKDDQTKCKVEERGDLSAVKVDVLGVGGDKVLLFSFVLEGQTCQVVIHRSE